MKKINSFLIVFEKKKLDSCKILFFVVRYKFGYVGIWFWIFDFNLVWSLLVGVLYGFFECDGNMVLDKFVVCF